MKNNNNNKETKKKSRKGLIIGLAIGLGLSAAAAIAAPLAVYYTNKNQTQSYTIVFDANYDGGQTTTVTVKANQTLTKPLDPAQEGYTFNGWYKDRECKTAFDFNTKINTNFTLFAGWVVAPEPSVTHTITYDDCHKDGSTITTSKVNDGSLAIMNTPEHRDEQGFLGWKEVKQDDTEEAKKAPYFDFKNRTIKQDYKLYGWWKYTVDEKDEDGKPYFLAQYIDGVGPFVKWNHEAKRPEYNDFNLVVPKQLDGKDIIGVAPYGFSNENDETDHLDIRTISLPDSIKLFSTKSFSKCANLRIINFPKNLFTIQPYCFEYCSKISDIKLNEGLERIETYAFSGNNDVDQFLKNVTMPSTLKHIGAYAFYYSAMETLDMSKCGNVDIGVHAFDSCWYLKNITLPEKLECIPEGCFFSCNSLRYLNIPKGVKRIETWAFDTCSRIRQINIAEDSELIWIGEQAFARNYSLEKINLPFKLKYFDSKAFQECYTLNSVSFANIREWVYALGNEEYTQTWTPDKNDTYANAAKLRSNVDFRWMVKPETLIDEDKKYNLTYVTNDKNQCYIVGYGDKSTAPKEFHIPAKITSSNGTYDVIGIGSDAFFESIDAPIFEKVVFETDNGNNYIQYIGNRAFYHQQNIQHINLDVCNNLIGIGSEAFFNCFKPSSGKPADLIIDLSGTKIEYIGWEAFYILGDNAANSPIKEIKFPTTIKTIGSGCFKGLRNLTSLNFPENCELSKFEYSLTYDGVSYSWYTESIIKDTSIETLDLSNTKIKYIAKGTFQNLNKTTKIILPEGLLEIASSAFSIEDYRHYTSTLATINIPSTCKRIGSYAFNKNNALSSVTFDGDPSKWLIYQDESSLPEVYDTSGKTSSDNATALRETYLSCGWTKVEE